MLQVRERRSLVIEHPHRKTSVENSRAFRQFVGSQWQNKDIRQRCKMIDGKELHLILISDRSTGLWTFKMEGFGGWNGEQWGMPDISSAQKWDEPVRRPISE